MCIRDSPGAERDTFIGLSKESSEIGRKMGITYAEDPIEYNLKVIDKLDPDSTCLLYTSKPPNLQL